MKRPGVAFVLSFLLPGAGLWYLGKWKYGFLNLGVVLVLGLILALSLPDQVFDKWIHYVAVGFSGGSAWLAKQMADQMNSKRRQDAPPTNDGGTDNPHK